MREFISMKNNDNIHQQKKDCVAVRMKYLKIYACNGCKSLLFTGTFFNFNQGVQRNIFMISLFV